MIVLKNIPIILLSITIICSHAPAIEPSTKSAVQVEVESHAARVAKRLEFRILPNGVGSSRYPISPFELPKYVKELKKNGPEYVKDYIWLPIELKVGKEQDNLIKQKYDGRIYVLASNKRAEIMADDGSWYVNFVDREREGNAGDYHSITARFDEYGQHLFSSLTNSHVGHVLAIVRDGKVIYTSLIKRRMWKAAISGDFTEKQTAHLMYIFEDYRKPWQKPPPFLHNLDRQVWRDYIEATEALAKGQDRAKLAKTFLTIGSKYPQTRHCQTAIELGHLLENMVKEDRQFKEPENVQTLNQSKKVEYYIYKLRDVSEQDISVPGKIRFLRNYPRVDTPVTALRQMGKGIVPVMIRHLEDRRPTRSVGSLANGGIITRNCDVALEIIESIADRKFDFRSARGTYLSTASEKLRDRIIEDIKQWWQKNKQQSAVQILGEIAWGEVVDGLQLGLGFDMQDRPYHQEELISFKVHVRNTTDRTIKLVCFGLLGWGPTIFDSNGKIVSVLTPKLGFPVQKQTLSLNPDEAQSVGVVFLELKPRPDTRWDGKSVYPRCYLTPGTYCVSQKYRFVDYPGANWHGELTTGELELTILPKPPDVHVEVENTAKKDSSASGGISESTWRKTVQQALGIARKESSQGRKRPDGLQDIDSEKNLQRVICQSIRELGDPERKVQEKAVRKLEYLGREAFDALVAALESDNWCVRNWAGHLLGYRGVVAVEPLCQALRNETHSSVRSTIVLSLSSIYSPDAVPALIDALEDENSTVKIHALLGLSYLRDKRAVDPLVQILKSKSQASLRQHAADALLTIDFEAAKKVLLHVAEKEQDEFLRSDFLRRAQSKFPPGYSYWPPELLYLHQLVRDAQTLAGEQYGHAEIEQLLEHIDSSCSTVSYNCFFGLGEMRAVSAIPAIIELLERRPREIGFIALGRMATPEAVQYIARAVRSEDLARRKAAVRGLADSGRWAVPLLIQLLDDANLRQAGHYEVPIEGFSGHWPDGHLAHVSLFQCLARAGLQGESKNLATGAYFNVDKEIAELKKWWARYGQRFLEGKSVPTPKISIVFVMT